jgi:hypothetical protein
MRIPFCKPTNIAVLAVALSTVPAGSPRAVQAGKNLQLSRQQRRQ